MIEDNEETFLAVLRRFLGYDILTTTQVFDCFSGLEGAQFHNESENPLEHFVYVPGTRPVESRVLLVAHADTVWDEEYGNDDEEGGIGADDRAGCAIVWILHQLGLGHSLLITSGEEQGQQGAHAAIAHMRGEIQEKHVFAVQFDRRNATDIKFYHVATPGFEQYVLQKTGYTMPDRASRTDICVLCNPNINFNGANLSVGYYDEHTNEESINEDEWLNTLQVARTWLSPLDLGWGR
jgi:hypothetical protein